MRERLRLASKTSGFGRGFRDSRDSLHGNFSQTRQPFFFLHVTFLLSLCAPRFKSQPFACKRGMIYYHTALAPLTATLYPAFRLGLRYSHHVSLSSLFVISRQTLFHIQSPEPQPISNNSTAQTTSHTNYEFTTFFLASFGNWTFLATKADWRFDLFGDRNT